MSSNDFTATNFTIHTPARGQVEDLVGGLSKSGVLNAICDDVDSADNNSNGNEAERTGVRLSFIDKGSGLDVVGVRGLSLHLRFSDGGSETGAY